MSWDDAVAQANLAIRSTFGRAVTYVAGAGRREIQAAAGDIVTQPVQVPGRGIVMRATCIWSIVAADLAPLLAGAPPKRGHRIEVADPAAGGASWVVESAQPDQVAGSAGWVVATYHDDDASLGAKAVERSR